MASTASLKCPRQRRGVILFVLAMLVVPLVDGLAKHLSSSYSPLFLGWARYGVAALVVLPFAARSHGLRLFPTEQLVSHVFRTGLLIIAMTLYFLSVARVPLATAASGYLVGPIVAVVLSVTVLKERMTIGKTLALVLGVAGSLVMLRPGGAMDPGILLAVGAGVLFGVYLIATRHAAQASDPLRTLAFQCVVGTLFMTPQAVAFWRTPALNDVPGIVVLGGLSALSHILSIVAFRLSAASVLAPLVYVELIGAAFIGYLAFGEIPGLAATVGAGFIVAAGLVLVSEQPAERRVSSGVSHAAIANRHRHATSQPEPDFR